MAYIGQMHLAGDAAKPLAFAIMCFVYGVLAAGVSIGVAYLCQLCYGSENPKIQVAAKVLHVGGVIIWVASLFLFWFGGYRASEAFQSTSQPTKEVAVPMANPKNPPPAQGELLKKNAPPVIPKPVQPAPLTKKPERPAGGGQAN